MFDVIERLKSEWTDKYVVIDSPAPELARFAKTTGQVKTVNMNGRCLVEFDQYNNIGWYDIDPLGAESRAEAAAQASEDKPAEEAAAGQARCGKGCRRQAGRRRQALHRRHPRRCAG
jgi:glyoxylate carboligase